MPEGLQDPRQVERRGLSVCIKIGSEDYFAIRPDRFEPIEEGVEVEIIGADPVEGRKRSVEDVILPAVLSGSLNSEEIRRLFNDTNLTPVAPVIPTDAAGIGVGKVPAGSAEDDLLLHAPDSVRETLAKRGLTLENVVGKARRRLLPDSRKLLQLLNQPCDGSRVRHPSIPNQRPFTGRGPETLSCSSSFASATWRLRLHARERRLRSTRGFPYRR
jgi:hypothetical protein